MDNPPVADARDAEDEPDQPPRSVERSGGDSAKPLADLQDAGGDRLLKLAAPGLALQLDAGGAILVRREIANRVVQIDWAVLQIRRSE
jgi:hypothetical protein